jgi:hypothetical protein
MWIVSLVLFSTIIYMAVSSLAAPGVGQRAYGGCILDQDWPDKPCLDTPPYSKEYRLQVWQEYYEFKGKEWMDLKKTEMIRQIENGTLKQWVETKSTPDNFANYNVWYYYYLNGEAPNAYGPQLTQEQLQECKELGIEVGKCSETGILSRKCLGPAPTENGINPCSPSRPPITFDIPLAITIAGVGAAVVAGIFVMTRFNGKRIESK